MSPLKKVLTVLIFFVGGFYPALAQQKTRLTNGWEFIKQDLGSVWEAVRPIPAPDNPESVPVWQPVTLPHCFNSRDAVDPAGNYYQGPGWYRTRLEVQNT